MADYKTPGVYVKEVPTLPPSVVEVSTAIPAFIGYTEKGPTAGEKTRIAKVKTLLEYESIFGKANPSIFTVADDADSSTGIKVTRNTSTTDFLLYYCLSMFFKNGGGLCYVISIGDYVSYTAAEASAAFTNGLNALAKEDEPTLIVLADATSTLTTSDYYTICQSALAQADKLKDRFVILDVLNETDGVDNFRKGIQTSNLMYGAAYHPYLKTSLSYYYKEDGVTVSSAPATAAAQTWSKDFNEPDGISVKYTGQAGDTPTVRIVSALATDATTVTFDVVASTRKLTIRGVENKTSNDVITEWQKVTDKGGFDISNIGDTGGSISSSNFVPLDPEPGAGTGATETLESIKTTKTDLYNKIKTEMIEQRITLPPSAAVAGAYAKVDRDRGVWKAPANVSLSYVLEPVLKITDDDQESLNVHADGGKSINAIRAFTGKGTLIWGARTLAGNDNEWRYVPVRRLFNMIEESTKKATSFAVFEPNDATTWLKVKGMIESYLYSLWERGALAGPTPESAYYVNVGLGKTMTTQDILEGRMIVEIGVAAVRPAEFIIIRFMHKLQEA